MINLNHAVAFQHVLWDQQLKEAQTIVDMTCGKGLDLTYIAQKALKKASIFAVDIQTEAISLAKKRVNGLHDVHFIQASHSEVLPKYITAPIDLAIFNLGYLPTGNHAIHTQGATTIEAVKALLKQLAPKGLITLVAYPGTEAGAQEEVELASFLRTLDQKQYDVSYWSPINQIHNPPTLYIVKGR